MGQQKNSKIEFKENKDTGYCETPFALRLINTFI